MTGETEPREHPRDPADARGLFLEADDATPLSFELNILAAETKLFVRKINPVKESYGRSLHEKMFCDVWSWAGRYRTSNKNIGVSHAAILPSLYKVYDDTTYWVDHKTFQPDEIAVGFHHALVVVQPFSNGNGRWSRLMADLLLHRLGRTRFSAGARLSIPPDEMRARYVAALRAADRHDVSALLAFMRA